MFDKFKKNTAAESREKKSLKENLGGFFRSSKFRYGGYNSAVTAVVLVILVVLNLLVGQLPSKYIHIDTSASNYYSIGETTKSILAGLTEDIQVYVLATEENADSVLKETLNRYKDLSDHIKLTYVDTAANPSFTAQYDASDATAGSLIVVSDKRSTVVDYNDIFVTEMDYMSYYTTGEYNSTTEYDGEGLLTSAIDYVTSDNLPIMYTLTGHGETSLDSDVASEVNKINITTEELNLMTSGEIPEDANAILINQPTKDLTEEEESLLENYMNAGGSVLVIPALITDAEMTNLNAFLAHYGMTLTNSLVIEGDSGMYYQRPYYVLPNVESHDITSPIVDAGTNVLLLQSQGIEIASDLRESLTVNSLLTTSDSAYAKVLNDGSLNTFEKEAGDEDGPFTLAAAATESNDDGSTAHLVVIASDALLDSSVLSGLPVSNLDVFLNSVSWMCEHESTISIAAKSMDSESLVVPTGVTNIFTAITMFLIPVGVLALGFFVWLGRRKR